MSLDIIDPATSPSLRLIIVKRKSGTLVCVFSAKELSRSRFFNKSRYREDTTSDAQTANRLYNVRLPSRVFLLLLAMRPLSRSAGTTSIRALRPPGLRNFCYTQKAVQLGCSTGRSVYEWVVYKELRLPRPSYVPSAKPCHAALPIRERWLVRRLSFTQMKGLARPRGAFSLGGPIDRIVGWLFGDNLIPSHSAADHAP